MSEKLKRAKQAIQDVFSDTSVTRADTYALLEELKEDIESCQDCLDTEA